MKPVDERVSVKKWIVVVSLPVFATVLFFWLGSMPAGPVTRSLHDKVAHFIAFGGLAVLCAPLAFAFGQTSGRSRFEQVTLCTVYASLIGGLLELWQSTLPHRSAEWLDFVADAAGAVLAGGLLWWSSPRPNRWNLGR